MTILSIAIVICTPNDRNVPPIQLLTHHSRYSPAVAAGLPMCGTLKNSIISNSVIYFRGVEIVLLVAFRPFRGNRSSAPLQTPIATDEFKFIPQRRPEPSLRHCHGGLLAYVTVNLWEGYLSILIGTHSIQG